MSPGVRKLALTVHLTVSVGWIGAVVAYLVLAVAAADGRDVQTVRAAWIAMELTGWYAIVPLAVASLVTGIVMAVGTRWGLFRHYWVIISLTLTVVATVVLVAHMPDVSAAAATARAPDTNPLDLRSDLTHPGVGLIVLLVIQTLNVYKPRGTTRRGRRVLARSRRVVDAPRGTYQATARTGGQTRDEV